jgi:hypothetical protein
MFFELDRPLVRINSRPHETYIAITIAGVFSIRAGVKEMQVKFFHGTNSITCANSVLPTFIMPPGRFKPEGNAIKQNAIQIVDTRKRSGCIS